jgi:hypothetical protein
MRWSTAFEFRWEASLIRVFLSYAHEDRKLQKELDEHLGALRHKKIIETWFDGQIVPGSKWSEEIAEQLNNADLILLLISSAFLNSTYCYENELTHAIKRHNDGLARIIPIILRPCHWEPAPFAQFQGLPSGMVPVTKHRLDERDTVWSEIAKGIGLAAESCAGARSAVRHKPPSSVASTRQRHSSNIAKTIDQKASTIASRSSTEWTAKLTDRDFDRFSIRLSRGRESHLLQFNMGFTSNSVKLDGVVLERKFWPGDMIVSFRVGSSYQLFELLFRFGGAFISKPVREIQLRVDGQVILMAQ